MRQVPAGEAGEAFFVMEGHDKRPEGVGREGKRGMGEREKRGKGGGGVKKQAGKGKDGNVL